jgi:ribosome-binding protein aMBF1 (putative translation factor)
LQNISPPLKIFIIHSCHTGYFIFFTLSIKIIVDKKKKIIYGKSQKNKKKRGKKKMYNAKLKAAIQKNGIKIKWLSEKMGVHPSVFSKWIAGEREPNDNQKEKLAGLLDCAVCDIF